MNGTDVSFQDRPSDRLPDRPGIPWFYYGAVFLASFLLFVLEPMLSKALLPQFGGSYLVWGASMVFFQAVLLAGYLVVHLLVSRIGVSAYAWVHALILAAAFVNCPFRPYEAGLHENSPLFLEVFRLLARSAGPVFMALSTISIIAQKFLTATTLGRTCNPYALYGASNLGALAGLFAYPVLIEPFTTFKTQSAAWWIGYSVMAIAGLLCIPRKGAGPSPAQPREPLSGAVAPAASAARKILWFLLSLAGCFALLAVTNVLTLDVASVPLLWALPLAVYMLTFVLTFQEKPWFPGRSRDLFNWTTGTALILFVMIRMRLELPVPLMTALLLFILFWTCLNCHGTLVEIKPAAAGELTLFYLCIGAGGFAGGILAAWIVPAVTTWVIEPYLCLALAALAFAAADVETGEARVRGITGARVAGVCGGLLVMAIIIFAPRFGSSAPGGFGMRVAFAGMAGATLLLIRATARDSLSLALAVLFVTAGTALMPEHQAGPGGGLVATLRNYYGVYRIFDAGGMRYLQHGTTLHGKQFLDPARRDEPLSYYHRTGPVGKWLAVASPKQVAMLGLGTGALAAYMRAGQSLTIYEIDPDGVAIAERYFSYLDRARRNGAAVSLVIGDGRLSLGKEPAGKFDVLILDAFNSGSIPAHLLTREALAVYRRALKPDGILFMHISNKHLDIEALVYSVAASLGLQAATQAGGDDAAAGADASQWVAITAADSPTAALHAQGWRRTEFRNRSLPRPWSDDYSNLLGILRW